VNQGTSDSTKSSLPAPKNGQADVVRERFEAAWRSAESAESRPRIDDYLREVSELERSAVFCDLLAVELQLRMQLGEQPTPDDYIKQFPESASQIHSIFHETGIKRPMPTSAISGHEPKTMQDVRSSLDTPTISFFPNRELDATQASKPLNGQSENGPPSTEAIGKRKRGWSKIPFPKVPGYEIIEEVGRGGMGIVYKARELQLERLVALKMIHPERGHSSGPQDIQRMLAEARAVAQCKHPNLVLIYKIDEQVPYLSLEFLEGGNLSRRLAGEPQPAKWAAALLETLARAMDFAHKKNIVHRDLKPSNILLSDDGTPKITDFGLAKRLDAKEVDSEEGWIVGTTMYMSAEQAWGRNDQVGAPADIYALGAILYEVLTGRPPFKAADKWETLKLVRTAEPVPPRNLVPQVPFDLELICLKCLRKDPAARYASAGQLADELRNFQEGRPLVYTRPTPAWEVAWKWTKRQPALASLMAVSLIALVSLFAVLYQRARIAESELSEQQRISGQRDKIRDWLQKAKEASDNEKIDQAQGYLSSALSDIESEPLFAEFKALYAERKEETDRKEKAIRGKQDADDKYEKLSKYRDDALFHGSVYTGVDLPTYVGATKVACENALTVFPQDAVGRPVLPEQYLSKERREACQAICYELLLILAAVEAPATPDGKDPTPEQAKKALKHLDRAAQFGRASHAYHMRRATYLKINGELDEAAKELALAAKQSPAGALDHFLTADSRLKQGRLTEAADEFGKAVDHEPKHFWAWYFRGMCNLQLVRPNLAEQNFTACLSIRTDNLWPHVMRGFANGQLGRFDDAERDFALAMKMLKMKPDPQAVYSIKVHQGNLSLSQAKLGPGSVPIPWLNPFFTPNLELAFRGAADLAYREERLAMAAKFLTEAQNQDKEKHAAYLYLGLVFQQHKDLDKATNSISEAIAKAKHQSLLVQSHLYGQRARVRRQQGQLDLALEDLKEAFKLYPTAEDHAESGRVFYELGRYEAAVAAYNIAFTLRPEEAEVYRRKADVQLHMLGEKDARNEKDPQLERDALATLLQYLAKKGAPSPEIHRNIGRLYARQREGAHAIVAYTDALRLQPDSATYAARGWAYLASENSVKALADFDMAILFDAKNARAYTGRALIRTQMERYTDALADAELALKHDDAESKALLRWNVAHVYARIAANAEKKKLRKDFFDYQNRAVDMIIEALQFVPDPQNKLAFWEDYIAKNALLAPLKGSVRFISLEKQYGQKSKIER
jgi:tetratricopeptide (TPR) repeat protein